MICKQCGIEFEPHKRGRKNSGFCCKKCADKYRKDNVYKKKPRYTHICENCGREFVSDNYQHKYCSDECLKIQTTGRTIYVKTCPWCGKEFETIDKKRVYCCSACAAKKHGSEIRGEYFCEYCGKPRWSEHPNRNRFCSRECAVKSAALKNLSIKLAREAEREKEKHKVCKFCGKPFFTDDLSRIYCSAECLYAANLKRNKERYAINYEPKSFKCPECGKEVVTTCGDKRRRYCSIECLNRAMHKQCKINRKVQMERAYVEPVRLENVYERPNGVCQICGLPVPIDTSPENPWGATRDHIMPLSKGGLHMNSNCQLAHRICNSMKLDTVENFSIDWNQKLITEPGRWNEQLDVLWEQLGCMGNDIV